MYDYYITNAPGDDEITERIKSALQTQYKSCKIFHEKQDIDDTKSWQDKIYDVSLYYHSLKFKCFRLTPSSDINIFFLKMM